MREERDFRSRADRFFGEATEGFRAMREDITGMRSDMAAHEQRDKERFDELDGRFGPVNQTIGAANSKLQWILGSAAGIAAIIGLAATIWGILK